jgi:hypothetical protein
MDKTNHKKYSNLKRRFYMLKNNFFALILCMFFSPVVILAQGSKEPKEKVEKVTEKMLVKKEQPQSDSLGPAEDKQTKKDFAEIRKTAENGTVPAVIKALSLAVFIAGLAFLYLPRKKKEVSNG